VKPSLPKFLSDILRAAPRVKSGRADKKQSPRLEWPGLLAIVLAFAGLPGPAVAQPAKIPLIGVLGSGIAVDPRNKAGLETLRDGLREFGYTEGKTISFVHRFAERDLARLPELADELVRLKIDIMFAIDSNAARAAKRSTSTVPIVILTGGDPVRNKLVTSLARPGANITGLTTDSPRLADKRLGLLKESVPKLQHFAYLTPVGTAGSENMRNIVRDAQTTAKTLGVTFRAVEVKAANPDFEGVFQFMVKERIDGLVTEGPPIMSSNRKKILQLAENHRLPAIHTEMEWANDGGLMSYGANRVEPYRRAALFIDKILKGTKPADLPVEQPTKFEFVINLKTAKKLNLTIPQTVMFRADRVIK
jgi:putative tryptophan/tyrosine transport system substrate-binding protein